MTTMKDKLNAANPNEIGDLLQKVKFGDIARSFVTRRYAAVPKATPADMIASTDALQLPDDAKGYRVERAYARAGTGTKGELIVDDPPMSSATAAGHVNVSESGDVTFAAADAWTSVDVYYAPEKLDVRTFTVNVSAVADVFTIPRPSDAGVPVRILALTSVVGGVTGAFAIIAPSDSKPGATKQASFKLDKVTLQTKASDAVTQISVKVGYAPSADLDALLEGSANPFI